MNISIETALIIIVPIAAGIIVMSIVTGQAEGATNFFNNQRTNSQCTLKFQEYKTSFKCQNGNAIPKEGEPNTAAGNVEEFVDLGELNCETSNWPERVCSSDEGSNSVNCAQYNSQPQKCGNTKSCQYNGNMCVSSP